MVLIEEINTVIELSAHYYRCRRGRDIMVVGFTITYATSAHHH